MKLSVVFRSFAIAHYKGLKYSFLETASVYVQLHSVWLLIMFQNMNVMSR